MNMAKVIFIHPDPYLRDFLSSYLYRYDIEVKGDKEASFLFSTAVKYKPDLIIISKDLGQFNIDDFFKRKFVMQGIKHLPVFFMGDFTVGEIANYKQYENTEFISFPLDPLTLVEKIYNLIGHSALVSEQKTPMLLDIYAKDNIFILQIEGNLEADKLDLIMFKLRMYCKQKTIDNPKFFIIIPSLYPESITEANLDALFSFLNFEELHFSRHSIKLLSRTEEFLKIVAEHKSYSQYTVVTDFIEGIQQLNINADMEKKIPLLFLKAGSTNILDLYDKDRKIAIPALNPISEETIKRLIDEGNRYLFYYSDKELSQTTVSENTEKRLASSDPIPLLSDYDHIEIENFAFEIQDEKMKLFYRKIRQQQALTLPVFASCKEVLVNSIGQHMKLSFIDEKDFSLDTIRELENKCILIILDHTVLKDKTFELLQKIRSEYSREEITVVIIAGKVNKESLIKFKQQGTDAIILTPVTTTKLLKKVFQYILSDQRKFE